MIAEQTPPLPENQSLENREPRRWRWTYSDLLRLDELGFFTDRRIELIDGEIIEMSPIGSRHVEAVTNIQEALSAIFTIGFRVRIQAPFFVGETCVPEPDALVVRGLKGEFKDCHPSQAALIVEVSDSALAQDRTTKASLYARAGVPEYWIVNLVEEQIEVQRRPQNSPAARFDFAYMETIIYRGDAQISPLAAPESSIAVTDLLP